MSKPILIVEDDPVQRQILSTTLYKKLNYTCYEATHGREALDILENVQGQSIKLVILDVQMPVMGGLETLEILKQKYPDLTVIMLTGSRDIDDAIQAMKHGAIDFIPKPYDIERLVITVRNAFKISVLTKEVSRLKHEKEGTFTFRHLIGHDSGLDDVVRTGEKAAQSDIPVLITGETGTGKEVFAKAIHGQSARAGLPFIAVNCGAIPSQLVESTLFGHEKGAFTGATDKVIGKFREADGGVIFLDEVGELPLDAQVKLLRVIQQKEVEPVGASQSIPINVRIISATNRNLEEEVKLGRFREDLFFRLNVLEIELPPLRERKQDIACLAQHFIERFCMNEGGAPKYLSTEIEKKMMEYDWPGNVRQLENTINRAMVLSDGNLLEIDNIESLYQQPLPDFQVPDNQIAHQDIQIISSDNKIKSLEEIEAEAMGIVLAHHDHNITKAAKDLGIAKSTFYKKMKTYHLKEI